jgi:chromosome segregation ATPase
MITDKPPVFSPEDILENFQRLRTDLSVVQNELDQALSVWRAILSSEKQEFKKQLEDREKEWDREESVWQKDRQAYEQKVQELEAFFHKQLVATEKNAVRALNELDTAWQQERLRWQQTVAVDSKESRQREELQNATQQQMEQHLTQLTEENQQLRAFRAEAQAAQNTVEQQFKGHISALEAQLAGWQAEKGAWQESLSERISHLRQNEENWAAERQQKESLIQSLQQQKTTADIRLRESEQEKSSLQDQFGEYINTLETQISVLQELVQQLTPPSHPLRRKSDASYARQTILPPPSSRAN